MVKIVTLFLIGMAVLAMFGRLRLPGQGLSKGKNKLNAPKKCRDCGGYLIGGKDCNCKKRNK